MVDNTVKSGELTTRRFSYNSPGCGYAPFFQHVKPEDGATAFPRLGEGHLHVDHVAGGIGVDWGGCTAEGGNDSRRSAYPLSGH